MKPFLILTLLATSVATAQEFKTTNAPRNSFTPNPGYVGIFLTGKKDYRAIATVLPNSPAEKAGVVRGDYILAVDQYSTAEMSLDVFLRHVAAPVGTYTQITLKKADTGVKTIVLLQRVPADFRVLAGIPPNCPLART